MWPKLKCFVTPSGIHRDKMFSRSLQTGFHGKLAASSASCQHRSCRVIQSSEAQEAVSSSGKQDQGRPGFEPCEVRVSVTAAQKPQNRN